jgi:hypothetical protein
MGSGRWTDFLVRCVGVVVGAGLGAIAGGVAGGLAHRQSGGGGYYGAIGVAFETILTLAVVGAICGTVIGMAAAEVVLRDRGGPGSPPP